MGNRTRVELGRREDLGADCANCFGLCCVALAFAKSVDFPFDKPAGEPCENLDGRDACTIHSELRPRGFKGCTVFDCFGAGQKISRRTFEGRSWRDDPGTRDAMFSTFPIVRRLHELLWYLDQAVTLVDGDADRAPLVSQFDRVLALSNLPPDQLKDLDVDAEFDRARPLLIEASSSARGVSDAVGRSTRGGRRLGPHWFAAPFGTKEYLLETYEVEGTHYEMKDGAPAPLKAGGTETLVLFHYLADGPEAPYPLGHVDVSREQHAYQVQAMPQIVPNAATGLYSPTAGQKTAPLNRIITETEILNKRRPLNSWDDAVARWKSDGGDEINAEYEEAFAATR